MAEIKIEKKTPIWPWIIVALIIAALAYYFLVYRDKDMVATEDMNDTISQIDDTGNTDNYTDPMIDESVNATSIMAYQAFVNDPNMTMDHKFTSQALNKLITATRDVAAKNNIDLKNDLDEAKVNADAIGQDSKSMDHADSIKMAAQKIANALNTMQTEKFAALSSENQKVQNAVKSIDAKKPTLEQKDNVKTFLNSAGLLLTDMDNKVTNTNNQ